MQPLTRLHLDPVQPGEASRLLMENELLRHEVAHLRARLAVAEPRVARPRKAPATTATKTKTTTKAKPEAKPEAKPKPDPHRARNATAYDDLVWLLGRLDGSPAGPLLRRVEGFRTLRARYLAEPPA